MRNVLVVTFCAGSALASIGCGPPYHMQAQAAPSPFTRPGCRAVVEPIHSEQLVVGAMPEAVYLSQKKAESGDSYMVDKQESDAQFHARIMEEHGGLFVPGGTPDNTFTIRPTWIHWEPGYIGFGSHPAVADFVVEVLSPSGQMLDKFDFQTAVNASLMNPSSGGRMRSALKKAGHIVNAYLGDNWLCAR